MVVRCFGSRYLTRVLMINKHQKHDAPHKRLLVTTTLSNHPPGHSLTRFVSPRPRTHDSLSPPPSRSQPHTLRIPPAPCAAVLMF